MDPGLDRKLFGSPSSHSTVTALDAGGVPVRVGDRDGEQTVGYDRPRRVRGPSGRAAISRAAAARGLVRPNLQAHDQVTTLAAACALSLHPRARKAPLCPPLPQEHYVPCG